MQKSLLSTKPLRVSLVFACLFVALLAKSQIVSTPVGGNWSSGLTWVGGFVPGPGNTVTIAGPVTFNVASATIAGLTISNNFNMTTAARALTVNGPVSGGGTWTTDANKQTILLSGNWSFNGTSTGSGASVEFFGNLPQSFTGVISSSTTTGVATVTVSKPTMPNPNVLLQLNSNMVAAHATYVLPTQSTGIVPGTFRLTANAMSLNGGVVIINAATWGANYSIAQPIVANQGSTVQYTNANPTIIGTPTIRYRTLEFTGSGTTTASGPIVIEGHLRNTGGGTLNFGSQNLTVSGDSPANLIAGFTTTGNFDVIVPTGTVTLLGNINASGFTLNFTGGVLDLGAGLTHTFTGNSTLTDGDIEGGSSTIRIAGVVTGAIGVNFTAESSTVELNGTVPQNVRSFTYNNLTLLGNSVKTFDAGAAINGTLSIQATATTAGVAPAYGPASTLEYAGAIAQTSGPEFPGASGLFNVRINNAAGVTLNAPGTMSGALTLAAGILNTTSTNLLTLNTSATASAGSTTAHVNGPLAKIGNTNFTFPVGKSGVFAPIGISAITASSTFTAEYFRGTPINISSVTAPLHHISFCENWQLNRTGTGNANVTLSWGSSSVCSGAAYVTNIPTLVVARNNGSSWVSHGQASFTGNAASGTITSTQVTAFSPFTLGSLNGVTNPLPVKLISFQGYRKNNGVQLEWAAETDQQFKEFIVERSANGRDFNNLTRLQSLAAGPGEYNWFDAAPQGSTMFYRLSMVDIDGKIIYSPIVKIAIDNANIEFSVYPNPVHGEFVSFQSPSLVKGGYFIKIFSDNGQEVYSTKFIHHGGSVSQAIHLPPALKPGIYNLQLSGDNIRMGRQFVLQ